ncbi:MAG TPA: hypothetical protein PLK63_02370, partial [Catalimonadaceae bacterium]|nr:hypothetical protein [Catalimonadaceae bacterium]
DRKAIIDLPKTLGNQCTALQTAHISGVHYVGFLSPDLLCRLRTLFKFLFFEPYFYNDFSENQKSASRQLWTRSDTHAFW